MLSNPAGNVYGNTGVQSCVCAPNNVKDVHTGRDLESLLVVFSPARILSGAGVIPRWCGRPGGPSSQNPENVI
jgi:hypothetical protein